MIYDIDKHNPSSIAVIDDEGQNVTYGEICSFTKNFAKHYLKGPWCLSWLRIIWALYLVI